MTSIPEMTNQELDRKIAEARGWEYSARGFEVHIGSGLNFPYKNKITGKFDVRYPSYTTDPRYAMELLEEMFDDIIQITPTTFGYEIMLNTKDNGILKFVHQKFCRAVSEAYLEWAK